ncbi:MAG: type II toxin-antitoxin system RelE/ParE family toxin [Chloroflexi bacterium]|nr:type II toxin-antitoxin system RelE/ParE family toxin [Chloroflexota bacterium]
MIQSFRHRGLRQLYEGRGGSRIDPRYLGKVERILGLLDMSRIPTDMDVPGFRLHSLSGSSRGRYAVVVSANWRVTFAFTDGNAFDVDLEDYH